MKIEYTIEIDEKLARFLKGDVLTQAEASTLVVAQRIAERARDNLRQHEAEKTGTAQLRSAKAAKERRKSGPTLHQQVEIKRERDGWSVGLAARAEWIGRFLEFANVARYWGRKSDGLDQPKPWLRPAGDAVRAQAADLAASEFRKRVK